MFLSIYNNQSGDEFLRRLSPSESLDLRQHVRQWAAREFGDYGTPVLSFSEPGSHIPNGCADWQAEIRERKESGSVCWDSEPFYLTLEESAV